MRQSKLNITRPSLLCAAVGLLGYLNTLNCGLCYDDSQGIINNPDIKPNVSWSNLLWNDFWGTPMNSSESHKSYRPLCVATFRLNYMLHELQPMGYHLVNVLLHGVVCYLYVQLCGVIFSEVWPALIAGLLFAVHPIHTEAVASVVGRADVLSGLFFIVTLLCYRRAVGTDSIVSLMLWLILSMVSCICALVSKETGFTVVAACIIYDFFVYHEMNLKSSLKLLQHILSTIFNTNKATTHLSLPGWFGHFLLRTTLFGLFATITAFLRLQLNNGSPSFTIHDNPPMTFPSPWQQIQWLHLCFVNVWLLLNPFSLSCDWRLGAVPNITSLFNIWNLATAITLFSICSLGFYSICTSTARQRNKYIIVSLSLIVFPYIPASNLFFTVGFYVAERVLYIPSMGLCILVSFSAWHIVQCTNSKQLRAVIWLAISSLLFTYTAKTLHRNQAWNSNYDLYKSVLPIFPNNAIMMNNLGVEISRQGDIDKGTLLLKMATELAPNVTLPHLALARLYRENDHWEEAERWYLRAAKLAATDQKPNQIAIIYYELGLILIRNQTTEVERLKKALKLFNASLSIPSCPKKTESLHNKGYVLLKLNQFHDARESLEKVLEVQPDHAGASYKLGEVFLNIGNLTQAEYYFRKSLSLNETSILAKFHLAALAVKMPSSRERLMEATQLLKEVLEVEPENENAVFALGVIQHMLGNVSQAKTLFEDTLKLNSSHINALFNLGFMLLEESNFTASKTIFQRLLDIVPTHYNAMVLMGSCLVKLGQIESGLKLYEEVIQLSTDKNAVTLALTNLGSVKKQQGELQEAIDYLSKAVAMDPTNQLASTTLTKAKQQLLQSRNATQTNDA